MNVTPPVITIDTDGWVAYYDSVPGLISHIEWVDVEDGEYRAFDGAGHLLELKVRRETPERRWWRRFGSSVWIDVGLAADQPSHADELAQVLRGTLAAEVPDLNLEAMTLPELLSLADQRRGGRFVGRYVPPP